MFMIILVEEIFLSTVKVYCFENTNCLLNNKMTLILLLCDKIKIYLVYTSNFNATYQALVNILQLERHLIKENSI